MREDGGEVMEERRKMRDEKGDSGERIADRGEILRMA